MISKKWIKNSIGLRIVVIGILTFLLMIPSLMILSLINERENRKNEVEDEISGKWGSSQILTGPILTIPYLKLNKKDGKVLSSKKLLLHILPENLNVEGTLNPVIRYRGIFKAVLYNSVTNFKGQFNLDEISDLNIRSENLLLGESFISFGISDMRGIKNEISLKLEDETYEGESGLISKDIIASGISFITEIKDDKTVRNFDLNINLNGSRSFKIVPIGKETNVKLKSSWTDPSFCGEYLPKERTVKKDGFIAQWEILHFNRNYPQKWVGNRFNIENSAFGVELLFPVDSYRKTQRTVKYSILFIGLTFLSFFLVEILTKKVLHPIQYILIGMALVLFYSLLLSLSEQMAFALAYFLSGIAIIGLITSYSKFVLKSSKLGIISGFILSLFYLFLYILLQLQDYSILVGSIGLLIILSIIMFVTRNIDWFTILDSNNKKQT